MVICLERDADLHVVQLMPLPLTVSCFSKIQIGFTFLVLALPGSPEKRAVKRVCVCVCLAIGKISTDTTHHAVSSAIAELLVITVNGIISVADPGIDGRGVRVGPGGKAPQLWESGGEAPRYRGLGAVPPVEMQAAEPPLGGMGAKEGEA